MLLNLSGICSIDDVGSHNNACLDISFSHLGFQLLSSVWTFFFFDWYFPLPIYDINLKLTEIKQVAVFKGTHVFFPIIQKGEVNFDSSTTEMWGLKFKI